MIVVREDWTGSIQHQQHWRCRDGHTCWLSRRRRTIRAWRHPRDTVGYRLCCLSSIPSSEGSRRLENEDGWPQQRIDIHNRLIHVAHLGSVKMPIFFGFVGFSTFVLLWPLGMYMNNRSLVSPSYDPIRSDSELHWNRAVWAARCPSVGLLAAKCVVWNCDKRLPLGTSDRSLIALISHCADFFSFSNRDTRLGLCCWQHRQLRLLECRLVFHWRCSQTWYWVRVPSPLCTSVVRFSWSSASCFVVSVSLLALLQRRLPSMKLTLLSSYLRWLFTREICI